MHTETYNCDLCGEAFDSDGDTVCPLCADALVPGTCDTCGRPTRDCTDGADACERYAMASAEPVLVRAYATYDWQGAECRETLYFVDADGTTYTTGPRPYSVRFDNPGNAWVRCDKLPRNAEFIGNYQRPATEPSIAAKLLGALHSALGDKVAGINWALVTVGVGGTVSFSRPNAYHMPDGSSIEVDPATGHASEGAR